jgi:hypothetical protein
MKKLTAGETNLLKEYHLDSLPVDAPRRITLYNRFSGDPVQVNAVELGLYNAAMNLYNAYDRGEKINVNKADRLKYLVCKLNQEAYSKLLD